MKGLFPITRRKKVSIPVVFAAVILILASWFFASHPDRSPGNPNVPSGDFVSSETSGAAGSVSVYYLDVGQGDSELICLPSGENILIDAGLSDGADKLTAYLKKLGVSKIDYLIATHPHADHIGGMAQVINELEIGKIYVPKVADSQVPTTRTYEDMLDAVKKKGLQLTQGKAGMTVLEQENTRLEFLAPVEEKQDDLNNYSIVAKLTFGQRTFLFTGDAEKESEQQMLQKYSGELRCDVLKVGHHGSNSSSSANFLKAVSPKYAIISCGKNNDYGHPHKETLSRLSAVKAAVYRTDEQGTILVNSNGTDLAVKTGLPLLAAA
ncbi:ComEC/Rec2 family competence protein [Faecalispora anaeroviscerum]|uniref:ComEC/Rec2 family competence protein n=1 Tax=Faecalispora anaeroviscerum TaxID=2991836 RepID=UPI0024B9B54E|nr:ComEC/Rec2 family competence protein [Faecalispora anaeroviscerum]